MHGWGVGEERKRKRHMWPVVPAISTTTVAAADSNSIRIVGTDSFFKDGRKIGVGDCALFKPPQESSPPFIGIIRWLSSGKDNYLKLGVNWLYRPADLKLSKGTVLEAAPNEIFYSFHEDEVHAASLLHPCKVAFLRKGVQLPSGVSSFVCRRVYDIENHCLWWLTDKDYINERQEEVDRLLEKTRLEMHAAVQSGGRSPKPLNGPTSTTQLKPGSDSVQNSSIAFPSQVKGKKRERGDQGSEPIKRERYVKTDDGDSGPCRSESMLKSEIAKITDRGGLVDSDGVQKLVQLMQPDRAERKIDLAGRIVLADVIAATDRVECLGQFVHLGGLSVLDEWLQEVHKGKINDSVSPKESDKSVEEFLFVLLRALDKLPVNLNALQTCNVGKSVNHLRTHKNLEIQKKARSLVDTWKKRVEAEMKINDAKSGSSHAVSWPSRPGFTEVSQGGNRRMGLSSEVHAKSSLVQPSSNKAAAVKVGQGDGSAKSASVSPGSVKISTSVPSSVAVSSKDLKEDRSSSSSQSQNNSHSCSSDHIKTVGSVWKEDARSSTAGSPNVNKASSGASRHRRSSNGLLGAAAPGVQKESSFGKSGSLNRSATSEKVSQSGLTCERTVDAPAVDHGNSHRLIVKFSNRGRSPARSATGGSQYDPSVMVSRASSPGVSEKHDQYDRKVKGVSDSNRPNAASDVNTESWQSNDVKDGFAGSDEGDGSPATNEDRCRSGDEIGKPMEVSKATCSSTGNEKGALSGGPESGKSGDATLSNITALIESCVKYSEANACMSAGDDGMNLLASVAAGEMSKSDQGSPVGTPVRNSPVPEESRTTKDAKSKLAGEDIANQSQGQSQTGTDNDTEKQGDINGPSHGMDRLQCAGDSKNTSSSLEEKPRVGSSSMDLQQTSDPCLKSDRETDEGKAAAIPSQVKDEEGGGPNHLHEKTNMDVNDLHGDAIQDLGASKVKSPLSDENKKADTAEGKLPETNVSLSDIHDSVSDGCNIDLGAASVKDEKEAVEESPSCTAPEIGGGNKKHAREGVTSGISTEHMLDPGALNRTDATEDKNAVLPSSSGNVSNLDNDLTSGKVTGIEIKTHEEQTKNGKMVQACDVPPICDGQSVATGSSVSDKNDGGNRGEFARNEVLEHRSGGPVLHEELSTVPVQETTPCTKSSGSRGSTVEANETDDGVSKAEASSGSVVAGVDVVTRMDFDLNEATEDDENQGEPISSAVPEGSSPVQLSSPLPFAVPCMTSSVPASITIASAAKGPFVPPENPLKNTGQLGWKGSAATSAFRPAEPRKVLEMSLHTNDVHPDTPSRQNSRPLLDIDLNAPGERVVEDVACQSSAPETEVGLLNYRDLGRSEMLGSAPTPVRSAAGLDLDLNRVGEDIDSGQLSVSTTRRLETPHLRSASSGVFPNGEVNVLRNFDLNNGPALDEVVSEPAQRSQHARTSFPSLPPVAGYRMSNSELGSLSSWISPGNSYPTVAFPPGLPDREQGYPIVATAGMQGMQGMQRILGPNAGSSGLGPDVYRPVLSSSPAMGFSPGNQFPYPGFPFSSNFPIPSTSFSGVSTTYMDSSAGGGLCFPAVPSQLVGPAGAVSSHYPRPYVINLPDGSINSGTETNRKWGRQGLDLNAGPGGTDMDGRDERFPSTSRQLPVASSHVLAEEQMRLYHQAPSGMLKRKEPEGGWDAERFSYKQPSWP